ncbi:MAG: S8 family serine peptidase [Alphaproteobacteria bacterium]
MQVSFTLSTLLLGLRAIVVASLLLVLAPAEPSHAGTGSSNHSDDEAPEADDHDRDHDDHDDEDRDSNADRDRDSDDDRDRDTDTDEDRDEDRSRSSGSDDDDDRGDDDKSRDDDRSSDDDKSRDEPSSRDDDDDKGDDKSGKQDKDDGDKDDGDKDRRSPEARASSSSGNPGTSRGNDPKTALKPEPASLGIGAAAAEGTVPAGQAVVALPASESRVDRAERMIEVVENKRGERVREGELLLITASKSAKARLVRGGYRILQSFQMAGLGLRGYRVAIPRQQDAETALARLRRIDPKGIASFNHIYVPARGGATIAQPAGAGERAKPARLTSAKIGLVDAPVNDKHPMLGSVRVESRSFGLASPTVDSHGTAVASRIAEAAPGARLFVASVFSEIGNGEEVASVDAIFRALDWLARNRIPVINLSLAGPPNPALEAVTSRLVNRGHKLVAAVGNEGPNAEAQYPAAYDGVVGVTAVDKTNRVYIYANQGDYVDFAAPGVDTTVAGPDGHSETVSGTSYAAPVIAAELARRLPRPDKAQAIRAEKELVETAQDLGEPGRDPVFGFGVIDPVRP